MDYSQRCVKSEPKDKNIQHVVQKSLNAAEVRGHSSGNTPAASGSLGISQPINEIPVDLRRMWYRGGLCGGF